jgi:uncharacterized damage-inducible protein DinB
MLAAVINRAAFTGSMTRFESTAMPLFRQRRHLRFSIQWSRAIHNMRPGLHGTLNHLLLTDRLWLKRLTGEGEHPNQLNVILYEDRAELTRARMAEDDRLIAVVEKYDEAALATLHSYKTTSGMPQSQVLSDILLHLFNHQTHHRGQAHACLSILTGGEPPSLDLLVFQRGGTAPNLEALSRQ